MSAFSKVANLEVKPGLSERGKHFSDSDLTVACFSRLEILEKLLGSHNIRTEGPFTFELLESIIKQPYKL